MTTEEQAGVAAIIYLQHLAGIVESEATALVVWRSMTGGEQWKTLTAHSACQSREFNRRAPWLP